MNTYLFDFDGTLVNSMPTFVAGMLRILDDHQITYEEKNIIKTITPLGYQGTAKYYTELGVPMSQEDILETMQCYMIEAYTNTVPAKKNVISVLKTLHSQGASLNVLTASPHAMLDPCLKRLGISDLFTNVWSCDDFHTTKSNPGIYKAAAEKIGQPANKILFLDDNYTAAVTAKETGMLVCGVFDESSAEYETEIRQVVDYYIRDFSELLRVT